MKCEVCKSDKDTRDLNGVVLCDKCRKSYLEQITQIHES